MASFLRVISNLGFGFYGSLSTILSFAGENVTLTCGLASKLYTADKTFLEL
jgi:hypothetical protein